MAKLHVNTETNKNQAKTAQKEAKPPLETKQKIKQNKSHIKMYAKDI